MQVVCNNFLSPTYIRIEDLLSCKVSSFLPSTLRFVAHWFGKVRLGQVCVNWIAKCQCIITFGASSRSHDTICNFHHSSHANSPHAIIKLRISSR